MAQYKSRFIAKNGIDNNSKTIINVTTPVNATDLANKAYASNASNITSGTINGNNVSVQNLTYTTTGSTPTASVLLPGQIAINSFDGNVWFMSNNGTGPILNQLVTLSSGYASSTSQTAAYRQTVLSGPLDVNTGRPNFLTLSLNVLSTQNISSSVPLSITYAYGFGNVTDGYATITTNSTIGTLNMLNGQRRYVYSTYNMGSGIVSYGTTAIPPQYGSHYPVNTRAKLQFNGSDDLMFSSGDGKTMLIDNYGNLWNRQYTATTLPRLPYATFASDGYINKRSALFAGATATALDCTDIGTLGNGPWSIGFHIKFNGTLPTSGYTYLLRAENGTISTGGYGAILGIQWTATGGQLLTYLSSTGSSHDIANGITSAIDTNGGLSTSNKWIYLNISFTGTEYWIGYSNSGSYMNWTKFATSSLLICPIAHISIGNTIGSTATLPPFQIDDFTFAPYSLYDGTGAGLSTTTLGLNSSSNLEGDYYNIPLMTMNSLTGNGANQVCGTVTNITSSIISTMYPHNFQGGERVIFDYQGYGSTLPTGITLNTPYYVINPTTTIGTGSIIPGTSISWISDTAMPQGLFRHQVNLLANGTTLVITGGSNGTYTPTTVCYIGTIVGDTISWNTSNTLLSSVYGHTTTLLPDGRLLLIGGSTSTSVALSTTFFGTISGSTITWVTGTALPSTSYPTGLSGHATTLLPSGQILITGGENSAATSLNITYFGTISGNTITWTQGSTLPIALAGHTISLVNSSEVLLIGGSTSGNYSPTTVSNTFFGTISGSTITWANGTALPTVLANHDAFILASGQIFVTGGLTASGSYSANSYFGTISLNEISWASGTSAPTPASSLRSVLIPNLNNSIFLCGGTNASPLANTYIGAFYGASTSTSSYTFQIATTPTGSAVAITNTGSIYGLNFVQSTILEQQFTYPVGYYNAIDNTITTRDLPHGLELGDGVTFTTTTPGGTASATSYFATPISDNKFRITSSVTGVTSTPSISSWKTGPTLNTSFGTTSKGLAYGAGKFVQVNTTSNGYFTSPDGVVWTSHAFSDLSLVPNNIAWTGTYFVAVSTNRIGVSPDGINWTISTVTGTFNCATGFGSTIVVSGTAGSTYVSEDGGSTWAQCPGTGAYPTIGSATYNSILGLYILMPNTGSASTTYYYSNTGIGWLSGTITSGTWTNVQSVNGTLYAFQGNTSTTAAAYSTTGTSWTALTMPSAQYWYSCAFINGNYVFAASGNITGNIVTGFVGTTTTAGGAPTSRSLYPTTIAGPIQLVAGNGVIVGLNTTGINIPQTISYDFGYSFETISTDTYTNAAIQPAGYSFGIGGSTNLINNIVYGKGLYLMPAPDVASSGTVVSGAGYISRSFDGLNWNIVSVSAGTTGVLGNGCYGAGAFMFPVNRTSAVALVGTAANIRSIDDGTTWTAGGAFTVTANWQGIAYGNGIWVAWAYGTTAGYIQVSTNMGASWTAVTPPYYVKQIIYAPGNNNSPGYFVAFTDGNTNAYYSANGLTWTTTAIPAAITANNTYSGGKIAAAGNGTVVYIGASSMYYATVGTWTWTAITPPFSLTLASYDGISIDYRNGLWVMMSLAGSAYSNNGIAWTSVGKMTGTSGTGYQDASGNNSVTVGNGVVVAHYHDGVAIYSAMAVSPIQTNATVLSLTDSNLGTIQGLPASNTTQIARVYLGEVFGGNITHYSYRGEYISDWFPVACFSGSGPTYTVQHNIGSAEINTQIYFSKAKRDVAMYEVIPMWGATSGGNYQNQGSVIVNYNSNSCILNTALSGTPANSPALDLYMRNASPVYGAWFGSSNGGMYTNLNYQLGGTSGNGWTTGFYKVHAERAW